MQNTNSKIQTLCMISLFTAVTAIMAQIAIPLPIGVPLTLQSFSIMLAGIILGARRGAFASLIYMLLGAIGLPVFSNFTGGWQCLVGPTGGFILSFPLMAYIVGLGYEYRTKWKASSLLGFFIGCTVNFLCGILMFCFITKSSFPVGFTTCALPFIPGEVLKAFLAAMLGSKIRKRLPL